MDAERNDITTRQHEPSAQRAGSPPPAGVRGNEWTALDVPEPGAWSPERALTIVVRAAGDPGHLPTTLAALAEQSYPRALTQILIVGEPSGESVELVAELGAESLGADPDGARARAAATGEILLFLDPGLILPRHAVEAHARWHHAVGDAAVLGRRRGLTAAPVDQGAIGEAVRTGELDSLLGGESASTDDWVDETLEDTGRLTDERFDVFRVGTRGSLSVRAETLAGARGFGPSVDRRGIELAYRLFTYGAIVVPDDDAAGWQRVAAERSDDGREDGPELERLVPVGGFRRPGSGLVRAVPSMHVAVAVGNRTVDEVVERIGTLLAGGVADVSVALELDPGYGERERLEVAFAADPRVAIDGTAPAGCPLSLRLPAVAGADPQTLRDVRELMLEGSLGALYATVPGQPAAAATVRAYATRALHRARRLAAEAGGDEEELIGELFRERWVSGIEIGVRDRDNPAPELADQGPLATNPELVRERSRTSRERSRAEREQAAAEKARRRAEQARTRERSRVEEAQALADRERERRGEAESKLKALQRSRAHRLVRVLWRLRRALSPTKRRR